MNTYPNEKAGITVADIENKFKADTNTNVKLKQKIGKNENGHGKKTKQTWVAEDNGKIIGFCVVEKNGKNRISAIYILPQYQNKGIGGKLMARGLKWLGNNKKIYVNVVEYNLPAINFYGKNGFAKTGKKGVFDSGAKFTNGKSMTEIELLKLNL